MKRPDQIKLCHLCISYKSFADKEYERNGCGCKREIWWLSVKTWKHERFNKRLDKAKSCQWFKPKK